jgi:hypothetical protein
MFSQILHLHRDITDHIVDYYGVHSITIAHCDIELTPVIGVCVVALSADTQGDAEVGALVDNTGETEEGVGIEPCPFGGCHSISWVVRDCYSIGPMKAFRKLWTAFHKSCL